MINEETNPLLFELAKKHKGSSKDLNEAYSEKIYNLALKHIEDDNCADYYGKHDFGTGIKLKFIMELKNNEGMYCMWKALEDAKKKLQTATGDKKTLYTEIVDFYTGNHKVFLLKKTMLKQNFTTMKKISSCQIECEKALALINKMIDNQEVDKLRDSGGDLFAYEINADIHFDWVYENENDYYTPEEQETASKLQDELSANNIQSIIYFI